MAMLRNLKEIGKLLLLKPLYDSHAPAAEEPEKRKKEKRSINYHTRF